VLNLAPSRCWSYLQPSFSVSYRQSSWQQNRSLCTPGRKSGDEREAYSTPHNVYAPSQPAAAARWRTLRIASKELKSKPQQKLDWLQVAMELLQQPDSEIGLLLLKEIATTELVAEKSYG
jgi:hypothetical protein